MEEQDKNIRNILITPFLNVPLNEIPSGEMRNTWDWQIEEIKNLISITRTEERKLVIEELVKMKCDAESVVTGYVVPVSDILALKDK